MAMLLLLQKALDNVYATYLAKGKHPFAYLSIDIAPNCVDVNVHPTKHEVHFLNEDAIIHKIQTATDLLLKANSTSRSFTIQVIHKAIYYKTHPDNNCLFHFEDCISRK